MKFETIVEELKQPFQCHALATKYENYVGEHVFGTVIQQSDDVETSPREKPMPPTYNRNHESFKKQREAYAEMQRARRATVMNIAKFHGKPVRIAIYEAALGLKRNATAQLLRKMKKEGLLDQRTIFIKGEGQFSAYMEASDGMATD